MSGSCVDQAEGISALALCRSGLFNQALGLCGLEVVPKIRMRRDKKLENRRTPPSWSTQTHNEQCGEAKKVTGVNIWRQTTIS